MKEKTVTLVCPVCGKQFEKRKGHYNWNVKHGRKTFCSSQCSCFFRDTRCKVECSNCKKELLISKKEIEKSKSQKFFCCHSCSAIVSNSNRTHTEETKRKIGEGLLRHRACNGKKITPVLNCEICGKSFKSRKENARCCSIKCHCILNFGSAPYTKDDVVTKIAALALAGGSDPSKKIAEEKLVRAATHFFSSWNKAVESAGVTPNSSSFQKARLKAKDGHVSDSISEMMIDNMLTENGWTHEKNKPYGEGKVNCDFYIPEYDLWVEYFGLTGNEWYDLTTEKKIELARNLGLNLVCLYPIDLYPNNNVVEKIKEAIGKFRV